MDTGIEFGEVQEATPEKSLRPDRNAHYAVVPYESPVEGDLPIFLDLDVLLDMEQHARSDTSVELGGFLLGGQYYDEAGQPFVVITDSIRAKYYESTKGSFKFTSETWTEFNRERNGFSPDLAMVGWYHTHPDWGVFLSGMDMFICNHFFNRPLDVAYVIDPCRGDRAFFQWTTSGRERCKRTRGFYVIASRYRQAELELTVAQLQGASTMPTDSRLNGLGGMMTPVVNVSQPQPPPHQGVATLAMLTLQFCLLALLAWKLIGPTSPAESTEMAQVVEQLERLAAQRDAEVARQAQTELLDQVLQDLRDTEPGTVQRLAELRQENARLASSIEGQAALNERLRREMAAAATASAEQIEQLENKVRRLTKEQEQRDEQIARLSATNKKLFKKVQPGGQGGEQSNWNYYLIGGLVLALLVIGGVAATLSFRPAAAPEEGDIPEERLTGGRTPPEGPAFIPEHLPEEGKGS